MNFREFITNRFYRRKAQAEFEAFDNIRPPRNPSRLYIDKLVGRLLDESKARAARKELSLIGPEIVPSLAIAIRDPRYMVQRELDHSLNDRPLEHLLVLLAEYAPDEVIAQSRRLVVSSYDADRKTAALHLASLGRDETISTLGKLLQDPNGMSVRT